MGRLSLKRLRARREAERRLGRARWNQPTSGTIVMMAFPTVRRSRSNVNLLTAILLVICAATSAVRAAETFIGKCVGVTDGDTINVMRDGRAVKVRLEGIDCPERGQDFSSSAKKYTSALVYGKTVEVRQTGTDRYGRVLAVVYTDGTDVNLALVRAGMAWHYKKYSSDAKLAAAENTARAAEIGLWSLPTPIAPWGLEERSERLGGTSDGQGRRRLPRQQEQPRVPQTDVPVLLVQELCGGI